MQLEKNSQSISDDSDMPEPRTRQYRTVVKPKEKFYTILDDIIDKIPYNYVLKNKEEKQLNIATFDTLIHKADKTFDIPVINDIIAFVSSMPYGLAKNFMQYMLNEETQKALWDVETL